MPDRVSRRVSKAKMKGLSNMKNDIRCTCKKLFCQIEGDTVIIKCRHCKKMIYIHTLGLLGMEYKTDDPVININSYR